MKSSFSQEIKRRTEKMYDSVFIRHRSFFGGLEARDKRQELGISFLSRIRELENYFSTRVA